MEKGDFLFEVSNVAPASESYGPTLCPGVSLEGPALWVGAPIILVLPNGQEIETSVKSFPLIPPKGYEGLKPIGLPQSVDAENIVKGTEVWAQKR